MLGHMVILCLTFCGATSVFHHGQTILYSHQKCLSIPISSHPWQYLLFFYFIIIIVILIITAIIVDTKWYIIVV